MMIYTARCPQCQHAWVEHRAIAAVRITPPGAKPLQRVQLACNNGCPCYGQQLPPPPEYAVGRPITRTRRKPIGA